MRLIRILTLLIVPSVAASCVQTSDTCAGWKPVYMAAATADFMAQSDPGPLKAIIGNHEFGKSRGCW